MGRHNQVLTIVLGALCLHIGWLEDWFTGARASDWSSLENRQQSITRAEFEAMVSRVYSPSGAFANYLKISPKSASLYSTPEKIEPPLFVLRFSEKSLARPRRRLDTHAAANSPLRGLRVVLDPGHIGGEWARMEERFFARGKDRPVQEAVLNLTVARLLQTRLESAGATVLLTKNDFQPVTDRRPEDFRAQAEIELGKSIRFDSFSPLEREAALADAIRKRQELLFYRNAEIAARARRINEGLKPDITLCIHFNAVEWNERFDLVDDNRLVFFVHGNYLAAELADDAQKFRLISKLLEGSHSDELAAAEFIASALSRATKLPPVEYAKGGAAVRVGRNPYVYARNLAANRLVDGPVVFLEPYYQNNSVVYQRIQLGDYDGSRDIDGQQYRSIFREYADAVADGLIAHYLGGAP